MELCWCGVGVVGVPVLLVVCDSAPVPLVWVMAVAVGVSWWCVFQWWVAVVCVSRRVPGVGVCVSWLVSDVSGACVGWLVLVGVVGAGVGVFWLVCVFWWFRMLMCSCLFFLGFAFLSCLVWLITGCLGFWCVGWVLGCLFSCAGCPTVFVFGVCVCWLGWLLLVRVVVWCFWVVVGFGFVLCACSLVVVVCVFLGGCCVRVPWWLLCACSLVVGLVAGWGWWCASVGCWVVVLCLLARACVRKCVGGVVCVVVWCVWLFGWRVACVAGWRVACVAGWRGCFGWCERGV